MRVGFLLEQALAPVPGGTGRYSVELASALVRTASADDEVSAWTAWHRDMAAARVDSAVDVRRLPLPRRALVAAWERGTGPKPRGVDLVHAPTLLLPPPSGPLVVTIHDAVPWTDPDTLTPRGVRWHRSMADRAIAHAGRVVVPTNVVRQELCQALSALDPARVSVLGAGVSSRLLRAPSPEQTARVRATLGLPSGFVLSLATLEPRKGLDLLVAALAELGPDRPPLVLVGQSGWGDVDVRAEAGRYGLPQSAIVELGRITDDELAVVLREATVLAAPSRAEGFGLPVAEAMAVGTAVVCSDAPAFVEVAGGAAVVVPRGDVAALAEAISGVLSDDERRADLVARGHARAASWSWDSVAARAWSLYREVLEEAGSTARW